MWNRYRPIFANLLLTLQYFPDLSSNTAFLFSHSYSDSLSSFDSDGIYVLVSRDASYQKIFILHEFAYPWLHFFAIYTSISKYFFQEIDDSFVKRFCQSCSLPHIMVFMPTYNRGQLDRTRKLWNLFLRNFWPLVPNFYLWKEDWVLDSVSYHFCDILSIS